MQIASFLGNLGPFELIIVLIIVLLLFGSRKLPELARSIGKSLGEFKKGRDEGMQSSETKKSDDTKPESKT